MRSIRGALLALGLVGAWYAWRNHDQLGQQLNMLKEQASQLLSEAQYQVEQSVHRLGAFSTSTNGLGERAPGEARR
jgi:hypothetical protein